MPFKSNSLRRADKPKHTKKPIPRNIINDRTPGASRYFERRSAQRSVAQRSAAQPGSAVYAFQCLHIQVRLFTRRITSERSAVDCSAPHSRRRAPHVAWRRARTNCTDGRSVPSDLNHPKIYPNSAGVMAQRVATPRGHCAVRRSVRSCPVRSSPVGTTNEASAGVRRCCSSSCCCCCRWLRRR